MSKNRKVFLMGAGAALDWCDAPSTTKLTDVIRKFGFKNAQDKYVTEEIFQWLLKKNEEEKRPEPNFETILSVIEDFLQFWSRADNDWPGGLNYFIDKEDDKWRDFIDLEKNQRLEKEENSVKVVIPGAESLTAHGGVKKGTHPYVKYFELLLIDLFQVISDKISDYSFYTECNQEFYRNPDNSEINQLVQSYIKRESKNNLLRIYSLNYDKIFQVLFEKEHIPIIQGFETKGKNMIDHLNINGVEADPKSVLFERDKHCVYHLHGNANWKINAYNSNGIEAYEYRLLGFEDFNNNNADIGLKIEQGKPLFLTNIITGYQKTQRISLSPLRQMMSAFDMDCYTADELIVIGYSFGDEHINDIIRQAKKINADLRIKIIDPGFDINDFAIEFISNWGNNFNFKATSDNLLESEQYKVEAYKLIFKQFLKEYT